MFFLFFQGACARQNESRQAGIEGIEGIGTGGEAIEEIMAQWASIERIFLTSVPARDRANPVPVLYASDLSSAGLIKKIDGLYDSVQAFLGSAVYRMYRYIPLSRTEGSIIPGSLPGALEEIQSLGDRTCSFRDAVSRGDREGALVLAVDIQNSLVRWQRLEWELEKFTGSAFLKLFLMFIFFLMIMAAAVWFLRRDLERSLNREKAGSVFSHALVLAQEEERSRIAGELHDTVAQDLRYLTLRMNAIGRAGDRTERERLCREAAAVQKNLMDRVRNICDGLVPPDFRFQGLPDALRRLCYDFGGRGLDCRIDVADGLVIEPMSEDMQLQAFRIVQEALTNVEKHAGAAEAVVVLRNSGGENNRGIFISVSDDGRGFSAVHSTRVKFNAPPPGVPGHLGLRSMYERCAILRGSLVIESEKGEGTIICLEAPLEINME
ncbi:MAG: sensor histidine kinase [Treponema sp.]|nr:sensor histidine kinase [Treponema sp.]